jgi:NTP pyrophosphatase (non-canonical NTP hydrolase)
MQGSVSHEAYLLELQHQEKVDCLKKSPEAVMAGLDLVKCDLLHMALGLATEVGELLTTVKAYTMYGKSLDRENLIEELGDLEFYMEGFRQVLDISRTRTLIQNNEKLAVRYKDKQYSDAAAIARADKPEGQ